VRRVDARVRTVADGKLAITYVLQGDLERVRIPPARSRRTADRLWQHTCCEAFVRREGSPAYHEFNFSPSGEWAAYAFERYREGGAAVADEALDPRVTVRTRPGKLELDAVIRLPLLLPAQPGAKVALALSAVVEGQDGSLSYWALSHPAGKPDFHHSDAFALELQT
jgi:hypothetical protein